MSASGHKRTWHSQIVMSALPPKADIRPEWEMRTLVELGVMMPGLSDWPNRSKLSRGAEPLRAGRTEAIGQENPVSCKGDLP